MRQHVITRKRIMVMIAITLLALLIGCGKESGTLPDKSAEPSKSAEPQKPVELVFYAISALTGTAEENAAQWTAYVQKKYPNISFKFVNATGENTVDNYLLAEQPIDILFGSFSVLASLKDKNIMSDMTDLVKKHNFNLERVEAPYVDLAHKLDDGKLPLLPIYDLRLALYYNKDVFNKFGVPLPKDGMTWEEILAVSRQLTRLESGVNYRGMAMGTAGGGTVVNQLSLGTVDPKTGKAVFQTDPWKRYLNAITPLFMVPNYNISKEVLTSLKRFEDGTAAMMITYNSYGTFTLPTLNLNWDVVSMPEFSGLRGVGAQPYPVYMGVSSKSKHREEAFLAISALLTDEAQIDRSSKLGVFSPLKSPQAKASFGDAPMWKGKNVNAFTSQIPAAAAPYVSPALTNIAVSEFNSAFTSIIMGEKDINTALRDAEESANKKIEALPK